MAAGRILLIEDRDALRRLLERALAQEGYEVDAAAGSAEGIRLVGERPYDLVLTDLMLPDGSGLQVLAASRERQPRVPVVVLTGFGTVGAAVEAMKLGAWDFLEKPVEIDDLARLAAAAIGGQDHDGVFQPPGAPAIVGRHPRLRAASAPAAAGGAHREHGPAHRRERHRQGAVRAAPSTPCRPRAARPVRGGQLRGDPRGAARERAVRSREGGLHRRRPPPARPLRARRGRHPVPRRDRRAAARGAGQGPAGARGAHLRARAAAAATQRADVRVVAATNRELAGDGGGRRASARTSSSGWTSSRSSCRRCASARATCR